MGMDNLVDFQILTIEGRVAQENAMFYPLQKTFNQSISPRK